MPEIELLDDHASRRKITFHAPVFLWFLAEFANNGAIKKDKREKHSQRK